MHEYIKDQDEPRDQNSPAFWAEVEAAMNAKKERIKKQIAQRQHERYIADTEYRLYILARNAAWRLQKQQDPQYLKDLRLRKALAVRRHRMRAKLAIWAIKPIRFEPID